MLTTPPPRQLANQEKEAEERDSPDGEFLSFDSILKSFFSSSVKNVLPPESGQHPSTVFTCSPLSLLLALVCSLLRLSRSLVRCVALESWRRLRLRLGRLEPPLCPVSVASLQHGLCSGAAAWKLEQRNRALSGVRTLQLSCDHSDEYLFCFHRLKF